MFRPRNRVRLTQLALLAVASIVSVIVYRLNQRFLTAPRGREIATALDTAALIGILPLLLRKWTLAGVSYGVLAALLFLWGVLAFSPQWILVAWLSEFISVCALITRQSAKGLKVPAGDLG